MEKIPEFAGEKCFTRFNPLENPAGFTAGSRRLSVSDTAGPGKKGAHPEGMAATSFSNQRYRNGGTPLRPLPGSMLQPHDPGGVADAQPPTMGCKASGLILWQDLRSDTADRAPWAKQRFPANLLLPGFSCPGTHWPSNSMSFPTPPPVSVALRTGVRGCSRPPGRR
jgi:hypothetical protein